MEEEPSLDEIVEMHAIVHGRVQGVFFRATTQDYAREFGVKGTVKNLSDGTVEIYAQGKRETLDRLISRLKSDAGPGYVESCSVEFYKPITQYEDFSVGY